MVTVRASLEQPLGFVYDRGDTRTLVPWPDGRTSRASQSRPRTSGGKVGATHHYLLHRVSAGESAAVRECIARFGGLIYTLARRVGLPEGETEDAVHEIFTELWKHGSKYDPSIASETAFVATIARRRLIDRRRRIGRQPVRQQISEETSVAAAASSPGLVVAEDAQRASEALLQLTNEQQRVLRLSVYEGLSHEMIARSTGLPLGTVKTHARRGLMKLRELLGKSDDGAQPRASQPATPEDQSFNTPERSNA